MLKGKKRSDMITISPGEQGLYPDTNGNWLTKGDDQISKPLVNAFGSNRSKQKRTDGVNTTSNVYQDYLSFTVTNLSASIEPFEFLFNGRWGYGNTGRDGMIIVDIDGTEIIESEMRTEPKDTGSDQKNIYHYCDEFNLSPGAHAIKLKFKSSVNGETMRMLNAFGRAHRV